MRFHLMFGVTPEEALAVQRHHGHTWTRCRHRATGGTCYLAVEAVFLLPKEQPHVPGEVIGTCFCAKHEQAMLAAMARDPNYQGAQVVTL